MNQLQNQNQNQLSINDKLVYKYLRFVDVQEQSAETYVKAIRQLSIYLNDNGITAPVREDLLKFREFLKETGHKNTTIQT